MALMPKRVKHRKSQRGRIRGNASRGNRVVHGDFALQATQGGWLSAQNDRGRAHRRPAVPAHRGPACTSASSRTNRSPRFRWKPAWVRERENRSSGPRSFGPGRCCTKFRRHVGGGGADVFRAPGPQDAGAGPVFASPLELKAASCNDAAAVESDFGKVGRFCRWSRDV